MDIKTLRCFVEVAERLNFSRAAEALFISQPTLSLRIQDLEKELNTTLFHRDRQKVFMTREGSVLLPVARDILKNLDSIPNLIQTSREEDAEPRSLMIGFDEMEERDNLQRVQDIMNNFKRIMPDVDVAILTTDCDNYEASLLDGTLDLCIMVLMDTDTLHPDFLTEPLLRESMVLAAPDAEGLALEEVLRSRDIVLLDSAQYRRWNGMYTDFLERTLPGKYSISYVNPAAINMSIRYGSKVTFMPSSYAAEKGGRRITVYPTDLSDVTLSLVWNKHNLNSALQVFVNEARAEIKAAERKKKRLS